MFRIMGNPESINAEIAHGILQQPSLLGTDLTALYAANQEQTGVHEVKVQVDRPTISVLYMSELLIGHQDSAVNFYKQTVEQVKALEEQPDVIVLSGFLQGDFKFLEKRRRATLVPGLDGMDAQFRHAKEMIDMWGKPVIYNMGNDDRRIAEEYTVEVFRQMLKLSNSQEGVPYYKIDQMKQHPNWNTHLQFQIDKVFPYCLTRGRRLYTAAEMAARGAPEVDEYFMLFHAQEDPTSPYLEYLEPSDSQLVVTDDVDLFLETKGRVFYDSIRHSMNFSSQPMYANHMKVPVETMGQMNAADIPTPNMLVTQHNQEEVGVNAGGTWVVSNGGLIRASNFLGNKGSRTDAPGDVSKRLVTTRRRIPEPSASMHERTDDGLHRVTIFNEALRDKADSTERMAIALYCDWQTGSITARPDLQVKFMDYVRTHKLGRMPTAIFVGGDIVHGRNYPDFPSESQSSGLMAMDSQIAFIRGMIKAELDNFTTDHAAALQQVIVEPGNHEWNSGTDKWHGYSFVDYIRDAFEGLYTKHNIDVNRVQFHDALMTPKGEVAKSYSGIGYFGDNGVLVQHFSLARGAKGNMGGLPVYQAQSQTTGVGKLKRSIDYELYGHWHHPQYGLFGNKLAIVGGSLAGLSGYEWWRGYRPVIGGTVLHIGGGLSPMVEFVSEDALNAHQIKTGRFSDKALKESGYKTDRDFDPTRHGVMLPRKFPKSALQKAIKDMMRDASERTDTMGELR